MRWSLMCTISQEPAEILNRDLTRKKLSQQIMLQSEAYLMITNIHRSQLYFVADNTHISWCHIDLFHLCAERERERLNFILWLCKRLIKTQRTSGDCANFQLNACSRPPLPITRTFWDIAIWKQGRKISKNSLILSHRPWSAEILLGTRRHYKWELRLQIGGNKELVASSVMTDAQIDKCHTCVIWQIKEHAWRKLNTCWEFTFRLKDEEKVMNAQFVATCKDSDGLFVWSERGHSRNLIRPVTSPGVCPA